MHVKLFTFREFTLSPEELQHLGQLCRDTIVLMDDTGVPPEFVPRQQLLVVVAKAVAALNVPHFKNVPTVVRLDDVAQQWLRAAGAMHMIPGTAATEFVALLLEATK